ncbi:MAG: hypothetical protein AMXMBFR36_02690 [Acidobacteriota bacterium]
MRRLPSDPCREHDSEAGFSLIEVLIAAAVLLLILIGILPLFERSRLNLMQGNLATKSSNAAIDVSERLLSAHFNSFDTNLPDSNVDELVVTDYFLLNEDSWVTTIPSGDLAQLTRATTLSQFGVPSLLDDDDDPFENALPGNEPTGNVHYKRFSVEISDPRTANNTPIYRIVTIQSF